MQLSQTTVLVTGSNRGLGRALVQAFLAAGARRVYAGARDPVQLASIASDRLIPIALDITNQRSLATAAERIPELDILVNNAGVLASYNVLVSTPAQIAEDFAINFYGTLAATRAFLPALERTSTTRPAALVNILSVVSLASMPSLGGYSAAKAAAYSATQALRGELAAKQISVHAVFPGAMTPT
ncbi:MAG: SDR family NAD(P)-dependent oxidoreductase [Kofleriaceae bacterium]